MCQMLIPLSRNPNVQLGSISGTYSVTRVCFILPPPPPPPQPLLVLCWVRTPWLQWGTPWGLGRASQSGCSKVERDSCTADQAGVVRAVLGVHDCRRRPAAQQRARGLRDKETWCLFTKTDNHCSIRREPRGGNWCLRHKSKLQNKKIHAEKNCWPFKHLLLP